MLRQEPILLWGDVGPRQTAEILEDERGLRPGGENYRGLLQTLDEMQSAMPARFAPKARVRAGFWGCILRPLEGVFAPLAARFV